MIYCFNFLFFVSYMYHSVWADQRLLQDNISYIALPPGHYLDS